MFWIRFVNTFFKVTVWPFHYFVFGNKVYYEDKQAQSRRIKGSAILISNHTTVYDYGAFVFLFPTRTLRYQMAEVLFEKQPLGTFLKWMGGIRIDRSAFDFSFLGESLRVLEQGGVLGVFPESRLPLKDEERPLPFKPSAAYIALESGAPIIPVYTEGRYFQWRRNHVIIGKPIDVRDYYDDSRPERDNLEAISRVLRQKIVELRDALEERTKAR